MVDQTIQRTCGWPADGHVPSGSPGARTGWGRCGVIATDVEVSTPMAVTLSRFYVCAQHLAVAERVGWNIHRPHKVSDDLLLETMAPMIHQSLVLPIVACDRTPAEAIALVRTGLDQLAASYAEGGG